MAYPSNKPAGDYSLRDYDFAINDTKKISLDELSFKQGYINKEEGEGVLGSVPDAHNHNWLFDLLHRNLRYTQQVAEENKYQLANKIATYKDIGQIKVGDGLTVTSNGVLSVIKKVAEDANIFSYDLPVGSYMLWSGLNAPQYFIEPAGQKLLKTDYPDLVNFVDNNNLWGTLYTDNNDGTFTVTDIRGDFIKIVKSNNELGKFTEAGLPNITGYTGYGANTGELNYLNTVMSNNAFYAKNITQKSLGFNEFQGHGTEAFFDASKSNNIYGNSTTVMPKNWGLKLILKALPTPPTKVVPTGTILSYTGLTAPVGYIIPNGAELSRTIYSDLWNWAVSNDLVIDEDLIPDTPNGYYGSGNGSSTFTVPDLVGVFCRYAEQGTNRGGAKARVYQPDGLPNIEGFFKGLVGRGNILEEDYSGCITLTKQGSTAWGHSGDRHWTWRYANINAHNASSIYGTSNYVQPKSVSLIPILKY